MPILRQMEPAQSARMTLRLKEGKRSLSGFEISCFQRFASQASMAKEGVNQGEDGAAGSL